MRALAIIAAGCLCVACTSSVPVHDYTYACAATAECAPGWICAGGRCVTTGDDVAAPTDTATAAADAVADTAVAEVAPAPDSAPDQSAETAAETGGQCGLGNVSCLTSCAAKACPLEAWTCSQDPECNKVLVCYVACADQPCRLGCVQNTPEGSKTKLNALAKCLSTQCL